MLSRCDKCNINYTTVKPGEIPCVQCGGILKDYEYNEPLKGFFKEDNMTEDMSGKCPKCGGPMEKWKEEKGYTCIECFKKDNPIKTVGGGTKGPFTPQTSSKPSRSIDELAEEMKSCMVASNNLLKSVDGTIKWTSEDVRATGNTLFIQKNRE